MNKLKYTKIKDLKQYTSYCNKHEELFMKDEEKFCDEIQLLEVLIEDYDKRIQDPLRQRLFPKSFACETSSTRL